VYFPEGNVLVPIGSVAYKSKALVELPVGTRLPSSQQVAVPA